MTKSNLSGVNLKPRFRSQYNYFTAKDDIPVLTKIKDKDGNMIPLPDLAVPNMSLSVKEIKTRYQRGQSLPIYNKNLVFTQDAFTPDVRRMDLTELHDMQATVKERIAELAAKHKEEVSAASEEAKKRSAANDERIKRIDDFIAANEKGSKDGKQS